MYAAPHACLAIPVKSGVQHHGISAPPSCRSTVHGGASSVRGVLVHRHIHPGGVSLGIPWFGGSSPSTMGPCDRGNVPIPTTHHGPFVGPSDREIAPSWPVLEDYIWCASSPTPATCKACQLCLGQSTQHLSITPPLHHTTLLIQPAEYSARPRHQPHLQNTYTTQPQ